MSDAGAMVVYVKCRHYDSVSDANIPMVMYVRCRHYGCVSDADIMLVCQMQTYIIMVTNYLTQTLLW